MATRLVSPWRRRTALCAASASLLGGICAAAQAWSLPFSSLSPISLPVQNSEQARIEAWREALRSVLKGSSGAFAIDLNLDFQPPVTSTQEIPDELHKVQWLADTLRREVKEFPNGFVLFRSSRTALRLASPYLAAVEALSSAGKEELQKLCGAGVPFSEVSGPIRQFVASRCHNAGLQKKMAAGDFVAISVRMTAMARFLDADGVERTVVVDPFRRDSDAEEAIREKLRASYVPPVIRPNRKPASSGDLDFGDGELLSLAETIQKAEKALPMRFIYDSRLAPSTYFWKGKFTAEAFQTFLQTVAKPFEAVSIPADESETRASLSRFLKDIVAPLMDPKLGPEGLNVSDIESNRVLSADELAQRVPSWGDVFTQYRIDRATQVTLLPALTIYAVAPGSYSDGSGTSPVGNRWSVVVRP